MQIEFLTGPPASGKSTRLLDRLKTALRARDWQVRLLVPSATLADHLRNQLAREGFLLRRATVSTLAAYLEEFSVTPAVESAAFERMLEGLLAASCPPDYAPVRQTPGFLRTLAATLDALSLAGVAPVQLEGALAAVYSRALMALEQDGAALRGHRLRQAAAIVRAGAAPLPKLLLDGFFSFAVAELDFLHALAARTPVAITQVDGSVAESFRRPEITLWSAADRQQEVLAIANRILSLVNGGVPLRRIGVLLRNPSQYAPLVDTVFSRLGVPSRSYLGIPLIDHPVAAFYRDFLAAADGNWDYGQTLQALRWGFTGLGGGAIGDALERQLREAMPGSGLEPFLPLRPILAEFADWPIRTFAPLEAAQQLRKLRRLFSAPLNLPGDLASAWRWNQRAAAIDAIEAQLDSTAGSLDPALALRLPDFWRLAQPSLRDATLRERDARRDVVHVMDLFEGRQWELDYVFAPGLAEGEFPKRFMPDPLLSENTKRNLGMKTIEDRQIEERLLFDLLLTRAHRQVLLTHPRTNDKGDPLSPSPFLSQGSTAAPPCRVVTPPNRFTTAGGQLLSGYREPRPWSASEFETYLACPWKHFARYGLDLEGLPSLPAERLDILCLGNIAHRVIRAWTLDPARDIESLAERELARVCADQRIPDGYHLERERVNLLRNLRLYADNAPPVPAGWRVFAEEKFSTTLDDGIEVRGQIDRYDLSPTGEVQAYDYKYSKADKASEKNPIQSALYAIVLGQGEREGEPPRKVSRFTFVGLRDAARLVPLEGATLEEAVRIARLEMTRVRKEVQSGLVPVRPTVAANCQYCDYHDACRIRAAVEAEEADYESEAAN